MSANAPGGFAAAVALHEQLLRRPDAGAASARLHPGRLDPPRRWTPDLSPLAPYRAYRAVDPASLGLGGYDDFHDIPDASLDAAIRQIVDTEGPVHFEVLADRLLDAAGVGRLGSRIRARIEERLEILSATQSTEAAEEWGTVPVLRWQAGFVARPGQSLKPPYRDWRDAPDKTRRLDYVSDEELMLALFRAVLDRGCQDRETAMNTGIHVIGFVRLTDNVRARLEAPLAALLASGMLVEQGGELRVAAVEPLA